MKLLTFQAGRFWVRAFQRTMETVEQVDAKVDNSLVPSQSKRLPKSAESLFVDLRRHGHPLGLDVLVGLGALVGLGVCVGLWVGVACGVWVGLGVCIGL